MAEHLTSTLGGQQLLELRDFSDVAEARRVAVRLAGRTDFTDIDAANMALVITEMTTNVIKHAKGGRLILRLVPRGQQLGVELMTLDQGPGINDLAQSMRDGYSTAGSPGTGLGAVKRLAAEFDIHSIPGKGTAVLVRLWPGRTRYKQSRKCNPACYVCRCRGKKFPATGGALRSLPTNTSARLPMGWDMVRMQRSQLKPRYRSRSNSVTRRRQRSSSERIGRCAARAVPRLP